MLLISYRKKAKEGEGRLPARQRSSLAWTIGKYLQKYVGTHLKAMAKALGNFFADRAFSAQDVRDPALWRAVAQVFLYSVCVSTARMNILWRL